MWCPKCKSEYREGFTHCASCDVDLVHEEPPDEPSLDEGPLTGRPLEEELEVTGPTIAGTFVTMDEAQAAVQALSERSITAEVVHRDEQLPMPVQQMEPSFAVAVQPANLSQSRRLLRGMGMLPVAVARFHTRDDAHAALSMLESKGLEPRLSSLIMDEIPEEFRGDMDPYILEVPGTQEGIARRTLEGTVRGKCEACGALVRFGEISCSACGEHIGL